MFNDLLTQSYIGNTVSQYLTSVIMLVGGFLAIFVLKHVLLKKMEAWAARTQTSFDDLVLSAVRKSLIPLMGYGVFYVSVTALSLNPGVQKALAIGGKALLTLIVVRFVLQGVRYGLLELWIPQQKAAPELQRQVKAMMPVFSILVWTLGLIFLLDNLGFKISTLVAGLGIGGIALALAAQTVLADVFSYFAIMLDRPFEFDDFIIVGDYMGSVEHIGIKTTRLRSLNGEQLVLSNKDLTDSRIRNYKRMQLRRIVFNLGVTYETPVAKLNKATEMIKDIIQRVPQTRLDRAHFASFGDSQLRIEVAYYVLSADYNIYMDSQQAINLAIKDAFEKEGIEFAFPTQVIYQRTADAARV